ncbi:MAG: DUF1569 domain-containing protein [Cyclobacteriaceae bacterium]|nr:DUF1569 domain-containing protein [Cyclobacteriaceae bacterium]
METGKKKLISQVADYEFLTIEGIVHPFFGKMSREQIGQLSYKHLDHHLRQFNA